MTTIYDIAQHTGVSVATVSRVINGRVGLRRETERRVRRAMDELNYRPRSRALDVNRVLVLMPDHQYALKSNYLRGILSGITDNAFAAGLSISLHPFREGLGRGTGLRHLIRQEGAVGAILVSMVEGYALADRLSLEGVPHVVVGHTQGAGAANQIVLDDRASARRATQFLFSLGHRDIGIVTCRLDDVGHAHRYEGFCDAMGAARGKELASGPITCDRIVPESAELALQMLLAAKPRPTAVVVTNETLALWLIRAARQRGIRVPEDLSVIAYESSNVLEFVDPPVTAMRTPTYEMGRQAVEMLAAMPAADGSDGEDGKSNRAEPGRLVELPHQIVIRRSTAATGEAAEASVARTFATADERRDGAAQVSLAAPSLEDSANSGVKVI